MADEQQNIDQAGALTRIQGYHQHFLQGVQAGGGEAPVTYDQMAAVLGDVLALFKGVGLGVRRNEIGQAHAPKRSWESAG